MLGFPIRTPPDHSSVANSPGLIAGSNVLHRLSMPRHPPCALHSLSHKPTKQSLQRCSRPLSRSQTTTPHHPTHPTRGQTGTAGNQATRTNPDASEPQQCANPHTSPQPSAGDPRCGVSMIPLANTTNRPDTSGPGLGCVLLRKEVIQPHLPVRLPCYDFVPIASPTFDGSPHKGWATGFGCCRLS